MRPPVVESRDVFPVGRIYCVGRNYAAHVDETKEIFGEGESKGQKPDLPVAFAKMPSHVIGHEDVIVHPRQTKELDYELELAVVIGRDALVGEGVALDARGPDADGRCDGDTNADRRAAGGHAIRNFAGARQHQCERSRPE